MSLITTIETDENCFKSLETEWLELLSRSITNTIFQTPQFLATWWKTLGFGTLHVVVIRDESQKLIGIAPFFIQPTGEGKKQLCMVGCVNVSDYLDVIIDKNHQQEVYAELDQVIKTKLDWEELFWCSVPEDSPTRAFLKETFSASKETVQDVCPQILLPNSWEEYLAALDRKQRHEVKRKGRKLEELDHHFTVITDEVRATEAVEDFIALHKASSEEKRSFWNDPHLVFFRALVPEAAKMGWLKLFFLEIEGTKVATMLVFDYNNTYGLYNSGFLPGFYKEVGTGTVLNMYTIKDAIEQKKTVFDFLRGGEEYKFRLGAVGKNVYDISFKK